MVGAESSQDQQSHKRDVALRYLVMQVGVIVLLVTGLAISWAVGA